MSDARLFFALWPTPAMQAALASAVSAFVRQSDGRPVPEKNFHLTLAFLGAVPQSRFEALGHVAAQCVQAFDSRNLPLVVTLDTIDHWRKSEILCATASATPPAAEVLSEAMKSALTAEGFAPDLKPFRAHATLARKVRRVTRDVRIEPVRWTFSEFHLVHSTTGPDGSSYSTVKKWVLDKRGR